MTATFQNRFSAIASFSVMANVVSVIASEAKQSHFTTTAVTLPLYTTPFTFAFTFM